MSPIPRRDGSAPTPLSSGQELFWLLDRATPGLTAYNVPRAYRIRGPLNINALQRSLDVVVERHEVLRTGYLADGEHAVQVVRPASAIAIEQIDLGHTPEATRVSEATRLVNERAGTPFDLSGDPMLRACLIRLTEVDHVLLLLTHHIASDGWSKSVLQREVSEGYAAFQRGDVPSPAPLPLQFRDYAAWERATLTGPELERRLAYWRSQLGGPLPVLELPTDRPRPPGHTFEGSYQEAFLSPELVRGMRRLGQERGASLYMVLLAAYQTLLHRYSEQDDIIVGSPTAGRAEEETQDLIGYFANALVLRTSFAGNPSFGALLQRVTGTCLDAYDHQDLPFETLVLELQKGQQLTHAPLFQCVLTMEDTVASSLELEGAAVEPFGAEVAGTKFDLTLLFSEQPEGLRLRLGYRTALFDRSRVERMLGHLRTLLEAATSDPTRPVASLPLLTDAERTELLVRRNATAEDLGSPTTVTDLFESHAVRIPSECAVIGVDGTLSWRELNAQANRIAHWLIGQGVGSETTVGLCLDRSAAMIAGLLGVLKAGGAYVPLLPDLPPARIAQQLADSAARIVVTSTGFAPLLPSGTTLLRLDGDAEALATMPAANPAPRATPESLAYVLFTSGSTGVPKGVAVTHANLVHYTRALARRIGLDLSGRDRWSFATVSTLGADLGHTAVFPALCSGGELHVLPAPVTTDPHRFAEYVSGHSIDLLKITPNHFRALLAGGDPRHLLPRRWLVLGGEACPTEFAETLLQTRCCRVLNHYGPTETTVGACTHELTGAPSAGTVPIGRPLPNTRVYVLDAQGEPTPQGIPGELLIGGAGVARGYLGRDDLTRERFIADRFGKNHDRLYRTGDRVRWSETGELDFLGRLDDQVKIRGHRVEPGEIEAVLAAHPEIRQAAVVPITGSDGALALAGYLAGPTLPDDAALVAWVRARLPDYMVPVSWLRLEQLPLNANGKIDRRALPAMTSPDPDDSGEGDAPATEAERTLAGLFAEVLKVPVVGRRQDFFALGGHSLLAIRLLGKISKAFGIRLSLRALFDAPTVADLAATLDPETPLEAQLASLWCEVLKRERVGRDESFFDLGGHSLLAIRLLGKISKAVGIRLSLRALFDAPTIRQLAAAVTAQSAMAEAGTPQS